MAFAPGFFCGLLFGGLFPGRNFAEFQKTRDEGLLAKFAIARLYGHFGSRGFQQNVVLCQHFRCIVIKRWWHLRQGVFSGLLFGGLFPGRNFAEFQKTRAVGLLAKFPIARLYGHFGRRGLQQNVVLSWNLNFIVMRRWWHLRQGVFCGLVFGGLSPGRNFAEFQKTRDEGLLAKFAITRLYGHFGRRGLQQNVVLIWHFKCILIRRWSHLRQGVFCGLHFRGLSPGRNFAEFQKTREEGLLSKFAIARLYGNFERRGLQQNVVLC